MQVCKIHQTKMRMAAEATIDEVIDPAITPVRQSSRNTKDVPPQHFRGNYWNGERVKWKRHELDEDGNVARYKAFLSQKGFKQKFGIDYKEIFAPVVLQVTCRVLLTASNQQRIMVKHADMKTSTGTCKESIFNPWIWWMVIGMNRWQNPEGIPKQISGAIVFL